MLNIILQKLNRAYVLLVEAMDSRRTCSVFFFLVQLCNMCVRVQVIRCIPSYLRSKKDRTICLSHIYLPNTLNFSFSHSSGDHLYPSQTLLLYLGNSLLSIWGYHLIIFMWNELRGALLFTNLKTSNKILFIYIGWYSALTEIKVKCTCCILFLQIYILILFLYDQTGA